MNAEVQRATENGNVLTTSKSNGNEKAALTPIESSDNSGRVPWHDLQIGCPIAIQKLVLGRKVPACRSQMQKHEQKNSISEPMRMLC
jgi:hypothetical protein